MSGIASVSPDVVVTAEGAGQVITGTAVDQAGNATSATAIINLDKTPPTLTAIATPAPNAHGWHNTDVTVQFDAADALSGVAEVSDPLTLTDEGAGQVVTGTAFDLAGNSSTAQLTVNLDRTPPQVAITSPADDTTVASSAVTVEGTVEETLSGVASASCNAEAAVLADTVFACDISLTEGPNPITAQAEDLAGNVGATSITVSLDTTPPVVMISTPEDGSVVHSATIAVAGTVDDATATVEVNGRAVIVSGGSFTVADVPLQEGANTLTATATDPLGNVGATSVVVTFVLPNTPPVITSTPVTTATECASYRYDVDATDSDPGDILTFTLEEAPTYMTIEPTTGLIQWRPGRAQRGDHVVTLRVSDADGLVATQSFTVTVAEASGTFYDLACDWSDGNNPNGPWSYNSGPGTPITTHWDDWSPNCCFVSPQPGWAAAQAQQVGHVPVWLKVVSAPTVPELDEPIGRVIVHGSSPFQLTDLPAGVTWTSPIDGVIDISGGVWLANTLLGRSMAWTLYVNDTPLTGGEVTPSTPFSSADPFDFADGFGGASVLTQTVSRGDVVNLEVVRKSTFGEVVGVDLTITVVSANPNDSPTITSTPTTAATTGQAYRYNVEATDPDVGDTLSFSLTTAPAGMTIAPVTGLIQWTPTATQVGDHPVTVLVEDANGLSDTQSFVVTVTTAVNTSPAITSTPVTSATEGQLYSYDVEATDPDAGDTLTFALVTSPAGMTIEPTTGLIQWTPGSTQLGSHPVSVRVTDTGGLFDEQQFTITVAPIIDFRRPQVTLVVAPLAVEVGEVVALTVNAVDDVGVVSTTLLVDGVPIPLDAFGMATFSSPTPGVFTAVATARDAAGNEGLASTAFRVLEAGDETPPLVAISSPADTAKLTVPTDIIGTASDETTLARYSLEYAVKGQNAFIPFASGTAPVTDGVLGQLDPTRLRNGLYDVRLTAEDASGNVASVTRTYQLDGEMKVGNFTISFNDLTIPVAGIPITITRTYDSRDKRQGDFGTGWTLAIKDIVLSESGVLGDDWQQVSSGGLFPTYFLQPTKPHFVTVTFSDSRTDTFLLELSPSSQSLVPLQSTTASFSAVPGTFSSLVSLEANDLFVVGSSGGLGGIGEVQLTDASLIHTYDPDRYQLTDVDGTVYIINQASGLERVMDPNGNTLVFGPDGIIHSSGKSVTFTRDAQGRITAITDPMGNTLQYEYDFYGDLVSVTDQEGNITRLTYNSNHGLIDVIDPRGVRAARNEYDDDGRLIATIDADGNRVEFTHNIDARQEVVRDRLGNVTIFEYDDDGNVIAQTDALGNTTTFTYDARGNQTSETDPLGNTTHSSYDSRDNLLSGTDAQGNTTSFTYNARNQLLTQTDPLGNVITHTYDAVGNLLTTTDASGNTTTNTYDAQGNVLSSTDNLGNVTTFTYDTAGHMISRTDPLGHITTFTYDANGNQLTETTSRTDALGNTVTTTTTNVYDSKNRLMLTMDHDGGVISIEYDALGKRSAIVDANSNRTAFTYNARGELSSTIYPDGSTALTTYDAEGRRASVTDRSGSVTTFHYDTAGRLIQTTYPGGATTSNTYDAIGRRTSWTDPNGNTTTFTHDAVGHLSSQTDPLGKTTSYTYDANGNLLSMTDANGNTTSFSYDALGRRTRTIFPDGSVASIAYDALARPVAVTDQAGLTTQFEYLGQTRQPTRITDALGNVTSYTYDEARNRVSQTDANGSTTTWAYDNLGRVVRRTLPLGMSETFTYDHNGNVLSRTDFNGQTTTFEYDANDRVIRKAFPDGSDTTFTYLPTGQMETVTDSRGVTAFTYDAGVLIEVVQTETQSITSSAERSTYHLTSVVNPDGNTLSYTYDAAGNRTALTSPSGVTSYTYDALNRLGSVTAQDGDVTTYAYNNVGNRASVISPNGVRTQYTYNSLNRLTRLETLRSDGSVLSSYDYTLGPVGNRLRVVEESGRTVAYTYDALYHLIQEDITDAVLGNETISYTYDAVGNRLSRTDASGTTSYTYDANDRLLNAGGMTYTYDANGNTLSEDDGITSTTYAYDFEDRLVDVTSGSSLISYSYDADGIRVRSTVNGASTDFLVDKNRDYAQVLEERDGGGTLLASYVYGDDLISQQRGGSPSYYHYDGLGSTRALTDSNEGITDTYTYEAFGELLESTESTENVYRFTGEQFDPDLGFYYLRARYYAPQTGRFVTTDPFDGDVFDPPSLHKYLYTRNDPVNNLDPSGEFTMGEVAAAIVIVGVLATNAIARPATFSRINYNVYLDFSLMTTHYKRNRVYIRNQVEYMVKEDFWPYAVDFTTSPKGNIDKHVYIGGSHNDPFVLGYAPIGGDEAFVYTDNIIKRGSARGKKLGRPVITTSSGGKLEHPLTLMEITIAIGNTASHELGHSFGMGNWFHKLTGFIMAKGFHVDDRNWSSSAKWHLQRCVGFHGLRRSPDISCRTN